MWTIITYTPYAPYECMLSATYSQDIKYAQIHMWLGLRKQGTLAHKIWLLFQTFMTHNFSFESSITMKFSTLLKHLMEFILQVTNQEYTVTVLRNDQSCNGVYFVPTCPVLVGPVTYFIVVYGIATKFGIMVATPLHILSVYQMSGQLDNTFVCYSDFCCWQKNEETQPILSQKCLM